MSTKLEYSETLMRLCLAYPNPVWMGPRRLYGDDLVSLLSYGLAVQTREGVVATPAGIVFSRLCTYSSELLVRVDVLSERVNQLSKLLKERGGIHAA